MKIIRTSRALQQWRKKIRGTIGFVPTMGALHEGHLELVRRARKVNDRVVVSIFVNPTQFGLKEDFSKYPRTEKVDCALLKKEKVDVVFIPKSPSEIYSSEDGFEIVPPLRFTSILEGKFRPGHFDGVARVVLKLFNLVQPRRAYFGEKDFQQLRVIEEMVRDLFLPLTIVRVPTKRARDGLALSSRNRYLSEDARHHAAKIFQMLRDATSINSARRELQRAGFQIQYLEKWEGRWLIAAFLDGVRLIDNISKN